MSKVVTPKFANEYLDAISKAKTEEEQLTLLKKYGAIPPLSFLLSMNYNKTVVFDLPEGMPPYKRDESIHPDLFAPLGSQIRRMLVCLKSRAEVPKWKKEGVFIEILEAINPAEADILVFCKDRALTELYPAITAELVAKVFPSYVK